MTAEPCDCGCADTWTLQGNNRRPDSQGRLLVPRTAVDRPAPTLTGQSDSWKWVPPGAPHTGSIRDRP